MIETWLSYLLDPHQQGLQPLLVALAVRVEEGEHGGGGSLGALDAGADQA